MNAVGNGVFGALPLIFAVGIAAGLAKAEKGSAGLSAVVGYFVLLTGTGAFMSILGKRHQLEQIFVYMDKLCNLE